MRLRDQIVVVTGANGAMGSVMMEYLKGRAKHVIGSLRESAVDYRPVDSEHSYITGDLTDRVSVNFMVTEILRNMDSFHAWINIAGGFAMDGPVDQISGDAWPRMFNLNYLTCLNTCQAILPVYKEQQFGRIINFGSAAGESGLAGAAPYAMSKAAVHNLTLTIAAESSGDYTANLIIPAVIDTPSNRESMPSGDYGSWAQPEDIAATVAGILDETMDPPNGKKFFV